MLDKWTDVQTLKCGFNQSLEIATLEVEQRGGGIKQRRRPLMCWSLLPSFGGSGGPYRRLFGSTSGSSSDPFWTPACEMVSTSQSKQPLSPAVVHPSSRPSVKAIWKHWCLAYSSERQICACRYVNQVCVETINSPSWIVTVWVPFVALFTLFSQSVIKWKHSPNIFPKHPNHFRGCFQHRKAAHQSREVWPAQENTPHSSRDGTNGGNQSGAGRDGKLP